MLSSRDPPQNKRYMQTKVKGYKKISCNWKGKNSLGSNTYSDKINFKTSGKGSDVGRQGSPLCTTTSKVQLKYRPTITQNHQN